MDTKILTSLEVYKYIESVYATKEFTSLDVIAGVGEQNTAKVQAVLKYLNSSLRLLNVVRQTRNSKLRALNVYSLTDVKKLSEYITKRGEAGSVPKRTLTDYTAIIDLKHKRQVDAADNLARALNLPTPTNLTLRR